MQIALAPDPEMMQLLNPFAHLWQLIPDAGQRGPFPERTRSVKSVGPVSEGMAAPATRLNAVVRVSMAR